MWIWAGFKAEIGVLGQFSQIEVIKEGDPRKGRTTADIGFQAIIVEVATEEIRNGVLNLLFRS